MRQLTSPTGKELSITPKTVITVNKRPGVSKSDFRLHTVWGSSLTGVVLEDFIDSVLTCCKRFNRLSRDGIATDSPVATFHFINDNPCDVAHVFTFDRNHRIGELLNHFFFLGF